jgi:DNA-binding LacI/PurR family transcriptional regulator
MELGFKADIIYQKLSDRIINKHYPTGMRLPTEVELCAEFSISRNTVRSIMNKLIEQELIYKIRGACYVKNMVVKKSGIVSVMYHGDMDMVVKIQDMILARNSLMSLFSQRQEGWSPEVEAVFLEQVLQQRHRGLLASCTPIQPYNKNLMSKLEKAGIRTIHTEPFRSDKLPDENYLMPDYFQAGYAAASALLIAGCRELILSTAKTDAPFRVQAQAGFEAAIKQHGIKKHRLIEVVSDYSEIIDAVKNSNGTAGVFVTVNIIAQLIKPVLRQKKLECGLISVELSGDHFSDDDAFLNFNRAGLFERALDFVFSNRAELKELVLPIVANAEKIKILNNKKEKK